MKRKIKPSSIRVLLVGHLPKWYLTLIESTMEIVFDLTRPDLACTGRGSADDNNTSVL